MRSRYSTGGCMQANSHRHSADQVVYAPCMHFSPTAGTTRAGSSSSIQGWLSACPGLVRQMHQTPGAAVRQREACRCQPALSNSIADCLVFPPTKYQPAQVRVLVPWAGWPQVALSGGGASATRPARPGRCQYVRVLTGWYLLPTPFASSDSDVAISRLHSPPRLPSPLCL